MNRVEAAKEWCWGCKHDDPICSDEEGFGHWAVWHKGEANGGVVYQCTAGEREVYRNLIQRAEEDTEGHCSWCGAGYSNLLFIMHRGDCPAAPIMGWKREHQERCSATARMGKIVTPGGGAGKYLDCEDYRCERNEFHDEPHLISVKDSSGKTALYSWPR